MVKLNSQRYEKMLPNSDGSAIASLQANIQQTVSRSYNFNGSYVLLMDKHL